MTNLHKVLAHPDRIRLMDHIARAGKAVTGREIARDMSLSERFVSRALNKFADVGLIVRNRVDGKDAFTTVIENTIADDIVWPMDLTASAHHALSNPKCAEIMDYLASHPGSTVNAVGRAVGVTQTTASKYLATMDRAGLIARRRENAIVYNSIADGIIWPVRVKAS